MAIDQLSALTLLSDLFVTIAGELKKLKGTPKQRFARDIIALFDIADQAERDITEIIKTLEEFHEEAAVGMRVHLIHKTGKLLDKFAVTCRSFIRWIENHDELSNALDILEPKTKDIWNSLKGWDEKYTKGNAAFTNLKSDLLTLQSQLQATKSPNPKLFPMPEVVRKTLLELRSIATQIQTSKELLRKFAADNLTIEDFFS